MNKTLLIALLTLALAGIASANKPVVMVTDNIATSTTWTADNIYNLAHQIYVLPGASLTIEAGTLVQTTAGTGGSLAVCRGAQIFVNGTADAPVIMTSTKDDLKQWHEGCNEWGNLTLMGNALISCSSFAGQPVPGNTATPTGLNVHQMEGLTADFPGDTKVMYGGNDDDDDSGVLHYLSIRYGGKVIGLGNELNGLSMGGIGRGTTVDHVDIMNNVDDGIETWGGTVNYKYISIWNIGDDSFDIDEGWRGKAQFGLLVQGYSQEAKQGSGVGDNCFEMDGAEDSDAQPVTTGCIYNFTAVGQPYTGGSQGSAWRDGCRMQFHNCIWMDLGEKLVKDDNVDGDGAHGYGYNGTMSFADVWKTPYTVHRTINAGTWTPGAFNDPNVLYQSQASGMLASITDSIFYHNLWTGADKDGNPITAYTEAEGVGVMDPNNYNVVEPNESPIRQLVRGQDVIVNGQYDEVPVTFIDPRPATLDCLSVGMAPDDGFFTPAPYRGAFGANNWLHGWTAAYQYGMTN